MVPKGAQKASARKQMASSLFSYFLQKIFFFSNLESLSCETLTWSKLNLECHSSNLKYIKSVWQTSAKQREVSHTGFKCKLFYSCTMAPFWMFAHILQSSALRIRSLLTKSSNPTFIITQGWYWRSSPKPNLRILSSSKYKDPLFFAVSCSSRPPDKKQSQE